MWRSLKVIINENTVQNDSDNFAIKNYLINRLTYSKTANESWRYVELGQAIDTPGSNDVAGRANE